MYLLLILLKRKVQRLNLNKLDQLVLAKILAHVFVHEIPC